MKPAYRSDIDGLRAIAVLLVVGFHAFPKTVQGGFIGVDVFFVISGFLITSIICQAVRDDKFSYANFYARRINRIFPALLLVLLACALVGWFLLFPIDYREAGKAIGFGAAFLSNIALLYDAGYFNTSSEFNPLLHLWSLGVEEQFYILWPPVIMLAWRWKNGPLVAACAILLTSFAANLALVPSNAVAAFYLPVTRFWELMVGCLLAVATTTSSDDALASSATLRLRRFFRLHHVHSACAWLGLILIVSGVLLIRSDRAFPGWWALLPVLGAALLIFAGPATWVNRHLLGNRQMVAIGLISYPLYLWHWPILAAIRIVRFGEEPPILMKAIAIAVAFGLAYLTYRWIEIFFRFGRPMRLKTSGAAFGVALVGIAGFGIYAADGFPRRFGPQIQALMGNAIAEAWAAYRGRSCFLEDQTHFAKDCDDDAPVGTPRIFLWGDSHAAHLYPGLRDLQLATNGFRISQYTTAACPPIFSYAARRAKYCTDNNETVRERLKELKPDTVIMAAKQWRNYDGASGDERASDTMIRATLAELRAIGIKHIIVVGQFPVWQKPPPRILAQYYRAQNAGLSAANEIPVRERTHLETSQADTNGKLADFFATEGVRFLSPTPTFCNEDGCLLAVPDGSGRPVDHDSNHLTAAGSIFFVRARAHEILGD